MNLPDDAAAAPVAFYHADFCFEARAHAHVLVARQRNVSPTQEHRRAVEASRGRSLDTPDHASRDEQGGDGTAGAWDAFHRQHAGVAFFKERRYLVSEFPQLTVRGKELTVLELGCGNGSSCVPLLTANPDARVVACDFAPAAVEAARQAVSRAGAPALRQRCCVARCVGAHASAAGLSSRFVAFQADPSAAAPAEFAAALSAAVALAGWSPLVAFDAVLAVFVLSAVPPARLPNFLAAVCARIRPGGALLVRDYGIYDQAHLRFSPAAARDGSGRLFSRHDGTLARFFERDELVDVVCSGAAGGGVHLVGAADWHTVAVRNRAKAITMRRVFVHAVFTRALDCA